MSSLPKWAQGEIEDLQRQNGFLRGDLLEMQTLLSGNGTGPFGVWCGMGRGVLWLPEERDKIQFRQSGFEVHITTRGELPGLQLMATSGGGLQVRPQASNVIHVEEGRR